jgi:hypothetical protein
VITELVEKSSKRGIRNYCLHLFELEIFPSYKIGINEFCLVGSYEIYNDFRLLEIFKLIEDFFYFFYSSWRDIKAWFLEHLIFVYAYILTFFNYFLKSKPKHFLIVFYFRLTHSILFFGLPI